ncbi:MAG: gluconate 2-dehydrogenase subunit 3 family protein [Gemmatimonadales bacterium]
MSDDTASRRAFLAASAAAAGSLWLAANPEELRASLDHARRALRADTQQPFEVLAADQAADIDAIASQIIPTDDLPGAHEAGAVYFIDHSFTTFAKDEREQTLAGLAAFNTLVSQAHPGTTHFAQLTGAQQLEFLQGHDRTPFFQQLRGTVLVAVFSNPLWGGNKDKAGWRILGFDDRGVWQPPFGWYDARANGGPN